MLDIMRMSQLFRLSFGCFAHRAEAMLAQYPNFAPLRTEGVSLTSDSAFSCRHVLYWVATLFLEQKLSKAQTFQARDKSNQKF